MTQIALDIEAISLVDDYDFEKPSDWMPFAIGLSCYHEEGSVESEVLYREDDSREAGRKLLWNLVEWIDKRDPDMLLTYNGLSYDIPILAYWSREYAHEYVPEELNVCSTLCGMIESVTHRDLFEEVKSLLDPGEKWPKFEEACASRDIDVEETIYNEEVVTGADMPEMGEAIMTHRPGQIREMHDAVTKYATSDVTPLFELADCLNKELDDGTQETVYSIRDKTPAPSA